MTPEIAELVGLKTQPKGLTDLAQRCKDLVKMSRDEMCKYYDVWDKFDMTYRGERPPDKVDVRARERGEPEKMILPMTYAQVETFTSFGHQLFNQREVFFPLIPSGEEDVVPARVAEGLLDQNLEHNRFKATKLNQFLTDIARFGVGVLKESWVTQETPVISEQPDLEAAAEVRPDMAQPAVPKMKRVVEYKPKYTGNKIVNVTPYRFFPDTRLPLTRWSEGEFAADETEESKSELRKKQKKGLVAGLEHVGNMNEQAFSGRRLTFINRKTSAMDVSKSSDPSYYLLTEVQIYLNPSETVIGDKDTDVLDKDLDCDLLYIIWILNDDRIVRISEAGYAHEEFGYNVAQFFDDQNRFINLSLADIISALQDTATWFLNSRITSVRKTIFNQLVADPSGVEIDDIVKRSPVIRLKAGRAGSGVQNWIHQLQVNDVTQGHLSDIASLKAEGQAASGINENLLGQFSPGRRSAKEAANVANYAAARLIKILACVWESGIDPMGRKMLINLQNGLDVPTLIRVYGQINTQRDAGLIANHFPNVQQALYQLKSVTKADLIGTYDFSILNGTLPSQRQAQASVLIEFLTTLIKAPQATLVIGLDPQPMAYEALELLGIKNVKRFQLTPQRLQQLMLMAGGQPNPGGAGPAPVGGGQPAPGGNPQPPAA